MSPSLFGPLSSCLITATFSLSAALAVLTSFFNRLTSVWCITLSYGFLNCTCLLRNCNSLLHSAFILLICFYSLVFHILLISFKNWFINAGLTYPAHLFLKSCATLKASSGIQSSISSLSLIPFNLDSYLGKWQVVGYLSLSRYLTPVPLSEANSPKFLNSLVLASNFTSLSWSWR